MKSQRDSMRKQPPFVGEEDLAWRFPERQFADQEINIRQPAICPRCHAFLDMDHWHFDEQRYRQLANVPDITQTLCPGCTRVERRLYEGEVLIRHNGKPAEVAMLLNLIHNEEARERVGNPTARIAELDEREDEIYILTTTQFLARRIGTELQKAFHGDLKILRLPQEKFTRIRWTQQ